MNGAGGRATSKSRRRVAGGSGSTSPDEVLERIGPRGDGELVSEAKFPASGSLQGISGILAQMGPNSSLSHDIRDESLFKKWPPTSAFHLVYNVLGDGYWYAP